MDRDEAIRLLKSGPDGVREWNAYRNQNPKSLPVLESAELDGADLREANLRRAKLAGASLRHANLQQACLHGGILDGTNLRAADLSNANLSGAKLTDADLCGSKLIEADLQDANLQGSDLRNADLRRSKLNKANFQEAKLQGADFTDADLSLANLRKAICDKASFFRTRGLYGRHQVKCANLEGAELATYTSRWDFATWDLIRTIGSLPLFGVSYIGIILICVWASSTRFLNHYVGQVRSIEMPREAEWIKSLSDIPLPTHMAYTLFALLLLAAATTLYKLFCPSEIQESSETRWVRELGHHLIIYRGLACSRLFIRWSTATCYIISGPWILYLLCRRVVETLSLENKPGLGCGFYAHSVSKLTESP